MQADELEAHFGAQLCIEVGERLVEQEGLWIPHDGAAQRHALALAAREGRGPALHQRRQTEKLRGLLHLGVDLLHRATAHAKAEGHVLPHVHVWIEGIGLEDDRDVAIAWGDVVDNLPIDQDVARRDAFETCDGAQQS